MIFQKSLKNIRKNNDSGTSWGARIALGGSCVGLGSSWDGLGPLLEALGHLLRDLGSLLGDLGSVLGDLDSVLGRSWGLLARSWVVLGVQESPGQGASVARGKRGHPPPSEIADLDPPPSRLYHYFLRPREEENETMDLKNRRSNVKGREGRKSTWQRWSKNGRER